MDSGKCQVSNLHAATRGSAGLDLVTTSKLILKEQDEVAIAPTGVWGPLPPGLVELILGRSSMTIKGILVQPGVVDSDYQREIKIMLRAYSGIVLFQLRLVLPISSSYLTRYQTLRK